MANFNCYLVSCVLLLVCGWRASSALPVCVQSAEKSAQCANLFRSLLLDVTGLLSKDDLCLGIPLGKVAESNAETVLACAPTQTQSSGCMLQRNSTFNESECLRNIVKDLFHYESVIQSYLELDLRRREGQVALLRPLLEKITSLRKSFCLKASEESDSSVTPGADLAQMWNKENFFDNRNQMCKMMRGFHVRIITINRAMGYISSGDHKK